MALVVAGVDLSAFLTPPKVEEVAVVQPPSPVVPELSVLSDADRQLYRNVFMLQHDKRYSEADAMLTHVSDGVLMGTVLGERYLNTDYKTSYSELQSWLAQYGDHPQAGALYHLALNRKPTEVTAPTEPEAEPALAGFSNGNEKSALYDGGERHWTAGLTAFRRHDMASAAAHFRTLLKNNDALSAEDQAAVAFWTYRALHASGDEARALDYAEQAARQPSSFYSILARHVIGDETRHSVDTASRLHDVAPLMKQTGVRRAVALKEIGEDALAEQQLRSVFPASAESDRKRLVTLAALLNLPAAQMRMALAYSRGNDDEDTAQESDTFYPMPRWMPTSSYQVEPALLFAIMRQESGFNPKARSAGGAIGVMQLMPATAHAMARGFRLSSHGSAEPSVNMMLGQNYLEHLMDTSFIGDNLVFLTAAYNAGPGTLQNWQHSVRYGGDPLLFIESIPFRETRGYVVRVMANYWVYSNLLGQETPSAAALAHGKWPHYADNTEQLSSMLSHLDSTGLQ